MNPKNKTSIDDKDLLMDNHPDAMVISDLNGIILAINEKLAQVFGKSKEDLVGTSGYENIERETSKRRKKIVEKVIKTKKPMELIDLEKGHWWKTIFQPILDNKGSVVKIAYYIQDITEKKESESKIKEEEDKYKTLFEGSTNPIIIFDRYGTILMINKTGASNLNLNKEECIGKSIFKLLPNLDKSYYEIYKRVVNTGEEITKEDIIEIPSIGKRYYWSIIQPISDLSGNRYGVQVISYDITDRKEIEQKLKESEEKYSSLFHNSNDSIFIHDLKGILLDINKQTLKLFKYNKKEILSKNIRDLHPSYELKKSKSAFQEISKKGNIKFEIDFKKKNGDIFPAEVSSSIFKIGNKSVIQGIVRDITKRKKAEYNIQRSKDYLQNIIDNTSEIIITIDSEFRIKTWNKTAEKIIGYKKNDIKNKKINEIDLFEYSSEVQNFIKNIINRKPGILKEINVKTSQDNILTLTVSSSIIEDEFNNIKEIIFICKDITIQIKDREKLIFGHSYIIDDIIINNSLRIFHNLLTNNKGVFIGRRIDEKLIRHEKNKDINIFKLSINTNDKFSIINSLDNLVKIIEKNINKQEKIILFDRIDYLFTTYTFEEVLKYLYKINDLIKKYNSIMIIRINSNLLKQKQLSLIYEEFEKIPSQEISDIIINDDLYDIIDYINNENNLNINVTYGNIGKMFNISKVTVKKRIDSLINKDLIYSRKIGKSKLLYLTDKGIKLISSKK